MSSPEYRSSVVVRAPQVDESVSSNNIEGLKTKTKDDNEHHSLYHDRGKVRHFHAKDEKERHEEHLKDKSGKHRRRSSGHEKEKRSHRKKSKTDKHSSRSTSLDRVSATNLPPTILRTNELELGELGDDSPEEVDIIELHSRITSVVRQASPVVDGDSDILLPSQ